MKQVNAYVRLLRPTQWLKNVILLFPPFLGDQLQLLSSVKTLVIPLLAFCLASNFSYIVNDIIDLEKDRFHPKKKNRPLAAGTVTVPVAVGIAVFLLFCASGLAFQVSLSFVAYLLSYLVITLLYSLKLKTVLILDIFCISSGFLLRLQAGGEAYGVVVSEWLFLSVFLLALFLSTGKRLCEKIVLSEKAPNHREVLERYPEGFLDGIMYMTGAAVLVTYTMYVVVRPALVYTVPLCCFGLMQYIFRVKSGKGGDPTQSLLRDPALFFTGAIWALMVGWNIYR